MATIRQEDFIQSVADAFQFISYYHPVDYIKGLYEAYQAEQSPAAKDAMAQILINSRMSAEGHRPICQDTGIAIAFIRVGMARALGHEDEPAADGRRRRAPRLHRTSTTRCALRSSPIPTVRGRTPATTRRRSCTSSWSRATRWK